MVFERPAKREENSDEAAQYKAHSITTPSEEPPKQASKNEDYLCNQVDIPEVEYRINVDVSGKQSENHLLPVRLQHDPARDWSFLHDQPAGKSLRQRLNARHDPASSMTKSQDECHSGGTI